jgi:iron complex outermembrane receptor protein
MACKFSLTLGQTLRFLILTGVICLSVPIHGQSFTGKVIDKITNAPIPYANVYFVELETGTSTDEEGIFVIAHPPHKTIHVHISFVGYASLDVDIDLISIHSKEFYLEPSHIELEEVVVSVPMGKLQEENVVNVERRKLQQLQEYSPITLSEAISTIPGVEQNTTGAGIGKPVIRGLSGNRIVTYAQGLRVENQQWGDEHGLGVGQVGIESVEVIKGPASLLYGSDALGGVLYFIDERYANHNTVSGFLKSTFLTNSLGSLNEFGIKLHKATLKLNLFGSISSNADYKTPSEGRVFNTRFNEQNIKTSIGFNKNKWIANLRYGFLKNNFGIADSALYLTEANRNFELPFQSITGHNLSIENTLISGSSKINLVLGYTDNHRKEFEDDANIAALNMRLKTFSYNMKWHSPIYKNKLDLVAGLQGMYQTNHNSGEEILIPDASTTDVGGFLLGNYQLDKLHLQAGVRLDHRTIDTKGVNLPGGGISALHRSFSSFNYSMGGVFSAGVSKVRANISSGFRAPNTSELLSYGIHEGTNRFEKGNPELSSENAIQVDVTYEFQSDHFSISLNPFYNRIQNYIFLSPTDTIIENAQVFEYQQTDAKLYGGELGLHYHPHKIHWLHLESNVSSVFASDKNNIPLPLIPAVKIITEAKVVFTQTSRFKIKEVFLQHAYRFKQSRIGQFETTSPAYQLVNIGANFEISTKHSPIEIRTGIKNLFNVKYIDHLSRFKELGIPNPGINVYIGLYLSFSKDLKPANKDRLHG